MITSDIKEGCAILERHAEQLKIQYGSALRDIAPEDKVVAIPGISGRNPKEISFRSLAGIIQSRMEEIIEIVNFEIQNSGYADKLAAGIVITGGGAMLKHLPQLMNFRTAMDVRIGYPNEHLAGKAKDELNQPMYATAVGLILRGFDHLTTYKKSFEAGNKDDYVRTKRPGSEKLENEHIDDREEDQATESGSNDKVPLTEKIKQMITRMFEVEDQTIN